MPLLCGWEGNWVAENVGGKGIGISAACRSCTAVRACGGCCMHAAVIDSKQQACALLFAHPQHACACTTRDREGARCVHPPIVPMLERAIKARRWCTAGRAGLPVVQSPCRGFRAALRPPSTGQHWSCTSPSGPWEFVSFWEIVGGK